MTASSYTSGRPPLTGILSTIGGTPLVALERFFDEPHFQLYAKLESFNPGGSIKDRAALNVLLRAIERHDVGPGGTVVESSSGNMGIGLAQVCRYFGLRFICVVDAKTTSQNVALLKAYGAELEVIASPDPNTGEFLDARLRRVRELLDAEPGSFWPNQYANPDNAFAHRATMAEITTALGHVDHVFCAVSTCGTLRGCAEYVREQHLPTRVCAVDAAGSVIFDTKPHRRLLPGHGASRHPELLMRDLVDSFTLATDLECIRSCRRLLHREAILAGASSGAILAAIERRFAEIERGAVCVAILADRGERYLDTVYNDEWVVHHFADWSRSADGLAAATGSALPSQESGGAVTTPVFAQAPWEWPPSADSRSQSAPGTQLPVHGLRAGTGNAPGAIRAGARRGDR